MPNNKTTDAWQSFCFFCLTQNETSDPIGKVRYVWLAKYGVKMTGTYPTSWRLVCQNCLRIFETSENTEFRPLMPSNPEFPDNSDSTLLNYAIKSLKKIKEICGVVGGNSKAIGMQSGQVFGIAMLALQEINRMKNRNN